LLVLVEVKGVDVDVVVAFVDRETQEMREEDKDWVFMWFLFFLGL
jgi:orotate phosphoribosyltransferase